MTNSFAAVFSNIEDELGGELSAMAQYRFKKLVRKLMKEENETFDEACEEAAFTLAAEGEF